ncbi:MAG: hypothetical protein HOD46_04525 [Actinobacteria bacterium]|jgi:hypothetical protein|nr:hypothetical protein [Actinomycetota bacterium]MBT3970168.1 hypothetical protein [Actinomycetota bacterium]MBT4302996.1 hypothetical protein [Actinomycetota bacterium]MBT5085720.1 hypothetical protein [Actinomycetota bacterium]MBT6970031.1 hypothetical protein [Actinomycetota bacterium]
MHKPLTPAAIFFAAFLTFSLFSAPVKASQASLEIVPNGLSINANHVVLSPTTDGEATTIAYSNNEETLWTAADKRGNGEGWHLTISMETTSLATSPSNQSGNPPLFALKLSEQNVTTLYGNEAPTSLVKVSTAIPRTGTSALRFLTAAPETGMGSYALRPEFSLIGTSANQPENYFSQITVNIVAGP